MCVCVCKDAYTSEYIVRWEEERWVEEFIYCLREEWIEDNLVNFVTVEGILWKKIFSYNSILTAGLDVERVLWESLMWTEGKRVILDRENFVHDENIRWIFQFCRTGLRQGKDCVRNERESLALSLKRNATNTYRILIAVFAAISCNLRFAWSFAKSLLFRIRTLGLQLSSDKVLCNRVTIFFSTKLIYRSVRAIRVHVHSWLKIRL